MIETPIIIKNRTGLHARAAAKLVETISIYSSTVEIRNGEKTVDGKSILSVMMLAASPGTELMLIVNGDDEIDVVQAIKELVENNFGEESHE